MTLYHWIPLVAAFLLLPAAITSPQPTPEARADFVGTWRVDLRPTPEAAPYYQILTITSVEDNTFEGTYYDSVIQDGHFNDDWGVLHFAFTTRDGSTVYHTTGQLLDGEMTGTTHAPARGFLAVWTAEVQP